MWRTNPYVFYLFLLISGGGYVFFGYHTTQENFALNFGVYSFVFLAFLGLYALRDSVSYRFLLMSAIVLHGLFLISVPTLSPDIYRFLWDGELITQGIHPYAFTPNQLVEAGEIEMTPYLNQLYDNITELSKANYSLYPTLNQFYFVIPAWLTDNLLIAIVIMRVLMVATLFAGLYFIRKTLLLLSISEKQLFLFALNPLVIIEATGNLHFEAVMFSFLAIALYFIVKQKWMLGAILFACAVNIKLTPLLLLPFFLNYLGWIKSLKFYLVTIAFSVGILLIFLWSSVASNFMQSIELYFNNFEFNSSFYRLISYLFQPIFTFETPLIIGPFLSRMALVLIVFLALFALSKKKDTLFTFMLLGYVIYLLLATTVHPWYVILPLGLSIYTHYRFVVYWSFMVMISYSFYALGNDLLENTLIALEYIGLFSWLFFEMKQKKRSAKDLF